MLKVETSSGILGRVEKIPNHSPQSSNRGRIEGSDAHLDLACNALDLLHGPQVVAAMRKKEKKQV
jgi:hypothetical protein